MAVKELKFVPGDATWHALRDKYTKSIPGRYSSLYHFNADVLGHKSIVPMTYRAHWAMCLFAEGMTGIKEIDDARIKMILVPRGFGKSTIITKGRTVHKLIRIDDFAAGIANETADGAADFVAMIAQEFEQNELLRALWPERLIDKKDTTWKSDEIVIKRKRPREKSPSVLSTGVGGTKTGVHMDEWLLDDILSQNAAENALAGSFSEIQSTNRWVKRLQPMLCSPKRDPITVIGTRWWEGDTYEWLEGTEEEPGYWGKGQPKQEYRWVLKLPDGETQTITVYRRGELAVFCRQALENGVSIFPERYTTEELADLEEQDPAFFSGQYLLKPSGGKSAEFQESWLRTYADDNNGIRFIDDEGQMTFVPFDEIVFLMSLDPAFSKKNPNACKTAIPVTGIWKDKIILFEDFAERGLGAHEMAQKAVDFTLRYPISKIFIESINAQAAVEEDVAQALSKAGIGHTLIEPITSQSQAKRVRIYAMQSVFKRGGFLCKHTHKNFRGEYAGFPNSAQRDVLDALAFQRQEWERLIRYGSLTSLVTNKKTDTSIQDDLNRLRRTFARRS